MVMIHSQKEIHLPQSRNKWDMMDDLLCIITTNPCDKWIMIE